MVITEVKMYTIKITEQFESGESTYTKHNVTGFEFNDKILKISFDNLNPCSSESWNNNGNISKIEIIAEK
jgi:hypothetical protein